jgi:uncharacterized protein (DUF2267 family)
MRNEDFVADVVARGGFEDAAEAERAISVVARVLGERLLPEERGPLAAALPEAAAHRLLSARYERDFDATELYDRVARGMAIRHGFGVEHTQAVCEVVGERLPEDVRLRLSRVLPAELHMLFTPRARGSRPPRPVHTQRDVEPGAGSTLASGRPGSRHAVSEAQAEPAHAESVARSDDPHGETKLSGARGTTQERLGETLAEGRPGPAAPLSETKR